MVTNKNIFLCLIIFLFFCSALFSQEKNIKEANPPDCAVIPLHGEVDFALSNFTKRSTEEAKKKGVKIIIFDIDTFGGRVDSALEISKTITDLSPIKTIAYVSVKAISAGALIALSADEIVMKKATTIGDCAPITVTNKGPAMLGEKFQSPLRAEFRKLAERNGYPVLLAQSMVSEGIEVVKLIYKDSHFVYASRLEYDEMTEQEKKDIYKAVTVVAKGELLTIHSKEALDLGFSSLIVKNEDELFEFYNIDKNNILKINFM
ncbi:serine protease, partial [bacterium]|nr:serine protease [bacterium]